MSYVPTPKEWIVIGATALKDATKDWDYNTKCDCTFDDPDDRHWECPIAWPDRTWVAMEVIRGLREAGLMKAIDE